MEQSKSTSNVNNSTEASGLGSFYELEDVLVYKLAKKLGGRSEVIDIPISEALTYLIIELEEEERIAEEKRWELFIQHLSRINSQAPNDKKQVEQQQDFYDSINPMHVIEEKEKYELDWDFEAMEDLDSLFK